jgi:fatty acid desaturase
MYVLGVYLSSYVDWCKARARTMPFWKILLLELLVTLGLLLLIAFAPFYVGLAYYLLIGVPFAIFGIVAHKEEKRQREALDDQNRQLRKTQKLLKGFRS